MPRTMMTAEKMKTALSRTALPGWTDLLFPQAEARDTAMAAAGGQAEVDKMLSAKLKACGHSKSENDPVVQELAAARITKIGHEIWPKIVFATAFLEPVVLADDEWPMVEKVTPDQEWETRYIGEFNGGIEKQAIHTIEYTLQEMLLLTSQKVFSPITSLMKGNISRFYQNLERVQKEMALDIDDIAKALVVASTEASGLRAKLLFHPDVVQASIPDLNYFDFSANTDDYGEAGVITIQKLRALYDYCNRFSSDAEDDSTSLTARTLFINPARKTDITNFVTLVAAIDGSGEEDPANTVPNSVRDSIWSTGDFVNLWGMNLTFVLLNSLAVNEAYVATNKPVGQLFTKPSMDEIRFDKSLETWSTNQESFVVRKGLLAVTHSPWDKNAIRIKW